MSAQLSARRGRGGLSLLFTISILLLLGASTLLIYELVAFSQREESLPAGISVAGVAVGGMQGRDAVAAWERAYAQPLVLFYSDTNGNHPIRLHPDQLGWRISSEPMLASALALAEAEGGFWRRFLDFILGNERTIANDIPLSATYQGNALDIYLADVATRYDQPPSLPGYDLQTLTVFPGESGYALDRVASKAAIDLALRSADARIVNLPVTTIAKRQPTLITLRDLIIDFLDSEGFIYDGQTTVASVFVLDLVAGAEISILSDVAFSAASTIKLPIMIEFFRAQPAEPSAEEAWLLANSLLCSNNASSNLLMEILGAGDIFTGLQSVTNTAQLLGARNTFLTAPFFLGVEGQLLGSIAAPDTSPNPLVDTDADDFNQTTAEDLGTLFNLLYDCAEFGSGVLAATAEGGLSQRECRQMLELASANDLQRLLQGGLPPGARIAHKNGWVLATVGDAGIVYPPNGRDYVIAVFLWEESEFQDYEKLWPLVEEISRAAWNFFNPENALLRSRENLPTTAVECEGNYLPPGPEYVDLDDINAWRRP